MFNGMSSENVNDLILNMEFEKAREFLKNPHLTNWLWTDLATKVNIDDFERTIKQFSFLLKISVDGKIKSEAIIILLRRGGKDLVNYFIENKMYKVTKEDLAWSLDYSKDTLDSFKFFLENVEKEIDNTTKESILYKVLVNNRIDFLKFLNSKGIFLNKGGEKDYKKEMIQIPLRRSNYSMIKFLLENGYFHSTEEIMKEQDLNSKKVTRSYDQPPPKEYIGNSFISPFMNQSRALVPDTIIPPARPIREVPVPTSIPVRTPAPAGPSFPVPMAIPIQNRMQRPRPRSVRPYSPDRTPPRTPEFKNYTKSNINILFVNELLSEREKCEILIMMIENGEDVNFIADVGKYGALPTCPLNFCVNSTLSEKDIMYIEILLEYGADPNFEDSLGKNSLDSINGKSPVKKELFYFLKRYGGDVYKAKKLFFIFGDDDQIFWELIEAGVDFKQEVNYERLICSLCHSPNSSDKIRFLVENGFDVNGSERSRGQPLIIALNEKYNKVARTLLELGAEIIDPIESYPLLLKMVYIDNKEGLKILLDYGVDVNTNAIDYGEYVDAMIVAIQRERDESYGQILIDAGYRVTDRLLSTIREWHTMNYRLFAFLVDNGLNYRSVLQNVIRNLVIQKNTDGLEFLVEKGIITEEDINIEDIKIINGNIISLAKRKIEEIELLYSQLSHVSQSIETLDILESIEKLNEIIEILEHNFLDLNQKRKIVEKIYDISSTIINELVVNLVSLI